MSLVAYWPLDEPSGNYIDFSGFEHDLSVSGTTRGYAPGFPSTGNSVLFDGTDTAMSSFAKLNRKEFSFESWIRPYSGFLDETMNLVTLDNGTDIAVSIDLVNVTGSTSVQISWYTGGALEVATSSATSISGGDWYHIGIVFGRENSYIYVNGQEETYVSNPGDIDRAISRIWISHSDNYFNGLMDDVAIYSSVLPGSVFQARYNQHNRAVVYDEFLFNISPLFNYGLGSTPDEDDFGVVDITLTGSPLTGKSTDFFDGRTSTYFDTGDYVTVDLQTASDVGTTGFAIGGWIRTNVNDATKRYICGEAGATEAGYALYILNGVVYGYVNDGTNTDDVSSTVDISDDLWHFVCLVYDGTNIKVFVDDTEVSQAATISSSLTTSNTFSIGAKYDGTSDLQLYAHDVFLVVRDNITSAEISKLYTAGAHGVYYSSVSDTGFSVDSDQFTTLNYEWEVHVV